MTMKGLSCFYKGQKFQTEYFKISQSMLSSRITARLARYVRECEYGYNDWRLPSIVELETLTDMSQHSPALPVDHLFINVQEFYWSSTISMYDIHYAWVLYINDGSVGVGYKPLSEFYLWPVRGKQ